MYRWASIADLHDANGEVYDVHQVDRLQSWHQLHSVAGFGVVDTAIDTHQHERVYVLYTFNTVTHKYHFFPDATARLSKWF